MTERVPGLAIVLLRTQARTLSTAPPPPPPPVTTGTSVWTVVLVRGDRDRKVKIQIFTAGNRATAFKIMQFSPMICRNCNNMVSMSKGAGLTVQENERFLRKIVLEGRNTNPGRRVKR